MDQEAYQLNVRNKAEDEYQRRRRHVLLNAMAAGLFIFIVVVTIIVLLVSRADGESHAYTPTPGIDPNQRMLGVNEEFSLSKDGLVFDWDVTGRATYRMDARVVHTKHYDFDLFALLAPVDLALGWGKIADLAVDEWIDWAQHSRWYFYKYSAESPLDADYIRGHSANVHILPASDNLRRAVRRLKVNDIVYMEGYLVDVDAQLGRAMLEMRTSLSRSDSGAGACEIFYVERLIVNGYLYR